MAQKRSDLSDIATVMKGGGGSLRRVNFPSCRHKQRSSQVIKSVPRPNHPNLMCISHPVQFDNHEAISPFLFFCLIMQPYSERTVFS